MLAILGLICLGWGIGRNDDGNASQVSRQATAAAKSSQSHASELALAAAKLKLHRDADEASIVGRWIDPMPYGLGVAVIKRSGAGYILLAEPTEVKHYEFPLTERKRHAHRRFYWVGTDEGDWFEILDDGRLQTGDKQAS